MTSSNSKISTQEFTLLVALLMSIVAISIDALLPALGIISSEITMAYPNQVQLVISALFLGMAIGQLVCGPLSDATGRKKVLYSGIALFLAGSVLCFFCAGYYHLVDRPLYSRLGRFWALCIGNFNCAR